MGKIKDKTKRVIKNAEQKGRSASAKSVSLAKKTARSSAHQMRRVKNTKSYQKAHKTYKKTHYHIAHIPHEHMMQNSPRYAAWHSWRWKRIHHGHVHSGLAIAWVLLIIFLVSSSVGTLSALSTWQQSDWSGGSGSSTSNQYSSASNINTSTSGQFSLEATANLFTNPGFDSNVNSWNGVGVTHETGTKRTGAGAAKVAAGTVSTANFYGTSTTSGNTVQHDVATADFNGDGRDDVVVAHGNSTIGGGITVYISGSDGILGAGTLYSTGATAIYRLAVGDIDNDGDIDVVASQAATSTTSFSIFKNDGSGTLTHSTVSKADTRGGPILLSDIDNDGWLDIVFNPDRNANIYLFKNDQTGSFGTGTTYPHNNTSGGTAAQQDIVVTDVNNDGKKDIVYNSGLPNNCNMAVLLGDGSVLESGVSYDVNLCGTTASRKVGLSAGDFNQDGYGDVVTTRRTGTGGTSVGDTNYATVLFGAANGSLGNQYDISSLSQGGNDDTRTQVADFNNDGKLDFAFNATNTISVYIGNGDGTFAAKNDNSIGYSNSHRLAVGSVKGDGKQDAVIIQSSASPTLGNVSVLRNRSGGDAITQSLNPGNTDTYQLEAYVYTDGSAVTSADAELFFNGSAITTVFTSAGGGWYKLTGTVTVVDAKRGFGVIAKQSKTIYVDDMSMFKYASSGILTSNVFDLTFGGDWGTLVYSTSGTGTVTVKARTSNNSDMSGAPAFSGCPSISSGTDLTGVNCITDNEQYIQYEITLTASSGVTPIFEDITIQYSAYDNDPPDTNATDIVMKKSSGGSTVATNDWTNGSSPYFEWTAAEDNAGGSGIMGYCLYLGTSSSADPVSTKGLLGTSPLDTDGACQFAVADDYVDFASSGYIDTALTTSNSPYYLNIKSVDNAGNVYGSNEQFQFRFDNTLPSNPAYISAPSQFVASKEVTLTWPTAGGDAASDAHSGLAGLQYRIGNTTWYGDDHTGTQDEADLLTNDGSYTTVDPTDYDNINEGNNIVSFRTWDQAGNVSTTYVTTVIKLNTSSPSSPQNVSATPSTNTTNSFAFSWAAPNSYQGSAGNLTYCYTINTIPTSGTCTFTDAGVTSLSAGAYATQPGENTFYVVARDEANNINYATAASITFTANTSAPGIPLDLEIADVSTRATSTWRLALSWNAPTDVGAGVASYRIFRSTDNNNFSQVASTAGSSYVDGSLSPVDYYYRVRACDSANNCGAFSSTVARKPTGRFTSPANITAQPRVSGVSTKKATVTWSTDRNSDSKISIGTSPGQYQPFQIASPDQVTDHTIELNNLTPGTSYFAKASWTDEDGNIGSSSEFTFKTEPAPSTQEVLTQRITLNSAQIRFTSVSAAKVVIQYGKSDNFGGVKEISTSLSRSTYDVEINGLDDGSKYFYRLNTFDAEGNEYTGSTVLTFTTPARPRIENLRFQPVDGEPTSTQKISWRTNVPASSLVRFTPQGGSARESSDSQLVTDHEIIVKDLQDDTEYTFIAESRDKDGNLAVSDTQSLRTALDTRPPKLFDIQVETSIKGTGAEARGQVIVSWRTDEPSTSQVAYAEGSNTTVFNNKTSEDTSLALEHIVIVSDLPTSRVYSVQPVSKDRSGNGGVGESRSAIIGRASDSVITIVLNTLRRVFGF